MYQLNREAYLSSFCLHLFSYNVNLFWQLLTCKCVVQVDPEGSTSASHRVQHVAVITNTHVDDESEYLFSPCMLPGGRGGVEIECAQWFRVKNTREHQDSERVCVDFTVYFVANRCCCACRLRVHGEGCQMEWGYSGMQAVEYTCSPVLSSLSRSLTIVFSELTLTRKTELSNGAITEIIFESSESTDHTSRQPAFPPLCQLFCIVFWQTPHEVSLESAKDNRRHPENLPLAPWYWPVRCMHHVYPSRYLVFGLKM